MKSRYTKINYLIIWEVVMALLNLALYAITYMLRPSEGMTVFCLTCVFPVCLLLTGVWLVYLKSSTEPHTTMVRISSLSPYVLEQLFITYPRLINSRVLIVSTATHYEVRIVWGPWWFRCDSLIMNFDQNKEDSIQSATTVAEMVVAARDAVATRMAHKPHKIFVG